VKQHIKQFIAPISSLIILVLGNGLFTTLVTLSLHARSVHTWIIGAVSAAYYVGFLFGAIRTERLIVRVGHIRAFGAFAACLTAGVLAQGLWVHPTFWAAIQYLNGYFTAGLYVIIESWLLIQSTTATRGRILALYMMAYYAAQASGQFLLNLGAPTSLIPFIVTAMLYAMSIVPVSLTRLPSPAVTKPSKLSFRALYRLSALGCWGSLVSGLIMGSIYSLLPIYISMQNMPVADVALFMSVIIFSGMIFQYPMGKLSDAWYRRSVLNALSMGTLVASILLASLPIPKSFLLLFIALFGAFSFALYPISVSYACDRMRGEDLVAANSTLLLAYGVGAIFGPLLAPIFMHWQGAAGLFTFNGLVSLFLLTLSLLRGEHTAHMPEAPSGFVAVVHNTPVAGGLDPRSS
jgi:MFS family permease